MTRHPTSSKHSVHVATNTNGSAVPAPVISRSSMPMARVPAHSGMPERRIEKGAFQTTSVIQAIASPVRKGQAVSRSPRGVNSSSWLERPTTANNKIRTVSSTKATEMAEALGVGRAEAVDIYASLLRVSERLR